MNKLKKAFLYTTVAVLPLPFYSKDFREGVAEKVGPLVEAFQLKSVVSSTAAPEQGNQMSTEDVAVEAFLTPEEQDYKDRQDRAMQIITDHEGAIFAYPIVRGDTIHSISKRFDVEPETLQKCNPRLVDLNLIEVGQVIIFPVELGYEYTPEVPSENLSENADVSGLPSFALRAISDSGIKGYSSAHYNDLVAHVTEREGYRTDIYLCTANKPTFGIGHLLVAGDRELIEKTPAAQLDDLVTYFFNKDKAKYMAAAAQQIPHMEAKAQTPEMLNALVGVNLQLGVHWRGKFPNTWKAICDGRYDTAICNIENSLWNRQTPKRTKDFIAALKEVNSMPRYAFNSPAPH